MRRFIVLGHTQPPRPPIPLNDAPGMGGRWDLLARCVTNALLLSHDMRRDTEVQLLLVAGEPRQVRISGAEVRRLNPDERSTLALVSKALEGLDVGDHETRGPPGLWTARRDLETILHHAREEGDLVWLTEAAATPLESYTPTGDAVTFALSDHRDPTPDEAALLEAHATHRVTLGPLALQADQCIVLAHNRLDRLGHGNL